MSHRHRHPPHRPPRCREPAHDAAHVGRAVPRHDHDRRHRHDRSAGGAAARRHPRQDERVGDCVDWSRPVPRQERRRDASGRPSRRRGPAHARRASSDQDDHSSGRHAHRSRHARAVGVGGRSRHPPLGRASDYLRMRQGRDHCSHGWRLGRRAHTHGHSSRRVALGRRNGCPAARRGARGCARPSRPIRSSPSHFASPAGRRVQRLFLSAARMAPVRSSADAWRLPHGYGLPARVYHTHS
jgi:hypothetical protein